MGTSTSSFGVGKRESHDATDFYARFAAPEISDDDVLGESGDVDVIHVGDARDMSEVPDSSVALVVTSPPYFAGKEYETALGEGHVPSDYIDYLTMLRDVLRASRFAHSSPAGVSRSTSPISVVARIAASPLT